MKAFVTGVGGQLGHDVMDELAKRGYEGIGSDILPSVDHLIRIFSLILLMLQQLKKLFQK